MGPRSEQVDAYRAACAAATDGAAADGLPEFGRLVPPVPTDGVGWLTHDTDGRHADG